jgi:hypothetical protein
MAVSCFVNRDKHPVDTDLKDVLADTYLWWKDIVDHCYQHYSDISEVWNFSGKRYGWSLRIKLRKRNLIYLIPASGYFRFAFVFSSKGVEAVMNSAINDLIKHELVNARTYAEGTGFRMDVRDDLYLKDIKELIKIKMEF